MQRHSSTSDISDWTVRQILHSDLRFHPYKMVVIHVLTPCDWEQHLVFPEMTEIIIENTLVIMSDKANFHLLGFVNKQNFRCWSGTDPSISIHFTQNI